MIAFLLALAACVSVASMLAAIIRRARPNWRFVWISLASAAPLPGAVMAWCAYIFIDAANAPRAECGVDACGMAMAAAMVVGGTALLGLVIAWIFVVILLRRWRL